MFRVSRFGLTFLVVAVLCAGIALGAAFTTGTVRVQGQNFVDDVEVMLQQIYERANPSVVSVTIRVPASAAVDERLPFIDPPDNEDNGQQYRYAQGSGFVYDTVGHIVTNAHVVAQANRVTVTFTTGLSLPATIVGVAPDSDLAVIKYDTAKISVPPLTIGDSDKVKVGTRAVAIGNPYELDGTMTVGFISAIGRDLAPEQSRFNIPQILQTDAAINPGNSGGPLLNNRGEVIGVNTAILRPRQGITPTGIGFAIPSNIVKLIADQLIETGKAEHSYLGITGTNVTTDIAELIGLAPDFKGVLVRDVESGGPAAKAGMRPSTEERLIEGQPVSIGGDIIVAIDGVPVRVFNDLLGYLFTKTKPGQTVKITVYRDGQRVDLQVTLIARPPR